jgi:hypothetical protein
VSVFECVVVVVLMVGAIVCKCCIKKDSINNSHVYLIGYFSCNYRNLTINLTVKQLKNLFILFAFIATLVSAKAQEKEIPKLDNPMSEQYLKKHLRKSQPRLVFNSTLEKNLRKKMKTDPVLQNMYEAIRLNAATILSQPFLKYEKEGRRLLGVSREMLYRINMLAFIYRLEKDPELLIRINDELLAVCNFVDWNPSHFLDVAEMSLAVALAVDWTAGDLPDSTVRLAKEALIEKALKPSWPDNGEVLWWVNGENNWNQVCNGGMIAAAIVVANDEPELAAKTIGRALDGLPHSLAAYLPDGIYPEGATYWNYGTSYSVVTAAMLESAFNSDFGQLEYPAFKESATFCSLMNTPSGWYYNFADCGDKRTENGDIILAWFAAKTGNKSFYEEERFLQPAEEMGKLNRLSGAAMVWLSQFEEQGEVKLPTAWKGEGSNPVVVFTGGENDQHKYYFGGKGGNGMVSHGNMDGGSFIFELNGVRWVVDPGIQNYNQLEQAGFDLWNKEQNSQRWTLLTKNNFGHSTISINDLLHRTGGLVTLTDFIEGEKPQATFDLTATLGDVVSSASRKFTKDSPTSILIEDTIKKSDKTELIVWQLMTTADVQIVKGGAVLSKDGETLKLENISHPELSVSVVSLCPAPLQLDRQISGLKRLEIRISEWTIENENLAIKVRLVGE